MKYANILMAVANEYWAIQPEKLEQIVAFLSLQAAGDKLSAEEIEARISKQAERDVARSEGSVAVLSLRGVIANRMSMMSDISGGTSSEGFGRAFDAAVADSSVKAIIIDTDTPGGVVSGADELSSKIFAARGTKPIIAHVNATNASAGYWITSAADEIVLSPSAEVGSIGVLGVYEDVSAALEKAGIRKTIISAGKYKAEGAPFAPMSEEAIAHRQGRVDHYYDVFVRRVAANRGVSLATVREGFGLGRTVTAQAAVGEKMADSIATLEDTLNRFGATSAAVARRPLQREKRALALHSF
ncbi:MAG: peptidase S49 [Ancylobacter novellus]|uniref:Peptidase S49 n=1 Tax=Ancylobacter novellus TaxID=921 RepID=A0A2W5QW91_ANCNO|nr:MAG: peptidase S49 [Ancylobacter novellus]